MFDLSGALFTAHKHRIKLTYDTFLLFLSEKFSVPSCLQPTNKNGQMLWSGQVWLQLSTTNLPHKVVAEA